MSEDKKNLKNQQLLEICGLTMFEKIRKKKVLESLERGDYRKYDNRK